MLYFAIRAFIIFICMFSVLKGAGGGGLHQNSLEIDSRVVSDRGE